MFRAWRRRFLSTIVAAVLGTGLVLMVVFAQVDLVRLNLRWLERIERSQVDDLAAALLLLAVGLSIDAIRARRRRAAELEAQRLRVLQATMRTVHDIVNNFLNNLQLVRIEGEGLLPEETLALFDRLSQEVADKLRVLGNPEGVTETNMASGVGIDYGQAGMPSDAAGRGRPLER